MNTTVRFFQDSNSYHAFRKAFAAGQNDERARKTFTESEITFYDRAANTNKTIKAKTKHDGWMNSAHFLLLNLVSGKDYYSGFTPKTKAVFLQCGGEADRGLNGAISQLATIIDAACVVLGDVVIPIPSWIKDKKQYIAEKTQNAQRIVDTFLAPLGGTLTAQDLARINLPSFPGLTREQVKEYAGKPITYKQLFGDKITDQTPDEDDDVSPNGSAVQEATQLATEKSAPTTATATTVAKKKGFLTRLFGG